MSEVEAEVENFDLTLKKKKKKKKTVGFEDQPVEAEEQQPSAEQEVEEMFSDLKKKKKKSKGKDQEDEEEETEAVEELNDSLGDLTLGKKKKKKKPQMEADGEEGEQEEPEDNEAEMEDAFAGMKKRKKKKDQEEVEAEEEQPLIESEEEWQKTDRDYTYHELLLRVFSIIKQKNPDLAGERRRYTMIPPQVAREGSKKTVFVNIIDICKRMQRQPEHLIAFILAELGTQGSVDGGQRLVIKGRFQQNQVENLLSRYIREYVQCKTCKSPETHLKKENRLCFLQCDSCGSCLSVSSIKSGFRAQTEKRKLTKA